MAPALARMLLLAVAAGPLASAPPEEELKAALVLSLARFADWPHLKADAPIRIGVAGRADFVPVLARMIAGRLGAGGRRLEAKAVKTPADAEGCQILYFSALSPKDIKTTIEAIRNEGVITVGDHERFLESGGAIHLFEEDGRIAFEVRLDALDPGVTISAKLLKLGHIVGPRGSLP